MHHRKHDDNTGPSARVCCGAFIILTTPLWVLFLFQKYLAYHEFHHPHRPHIETKFKTVMTEGMDLPRHLQQIMPDPTTTKAPIDTNSLDLTNLTKLTRYDIVFTLVSSMSEEFTWEPLAKVYEKHLKKYKPRTVSVKATIFACHDHPREKRVSLSTPDIGVVILPCDDSYLGLLNKTRVMRKWVVNNYNSVYVVKTDLDVVLNLKKMFKKISQLYKNFPKRLYAGDLIPEGWIISDMSLKWSDANYSAVQSVYPKYMNGFTYLLSYDLVQWLVDMDRIEFKLGTTLRHTSNEDSFVGMMLSTTVDVHYEWLGATQDAWDLLKFCKKSICHMRPTPDLQKRLNFWKITYDTQPR